jgi:hypothetical protein
MMSLDQAEAEFLRVCKEISALEKGLTAARKRAEKLAHYIEVARECEATHGGAPELSDEDRVIRLRRGRPRRK